MTDRPAVTPTLLEEYCTRFRNWGRWGPEDEIGTLNFITPVVIRHAATLVRQGKVISCALNFDMNGPQTGAFDRVNPLHSVVATGTDHVAGRQKLAGFESMPFGWGFADDQITMFLQCGTQWDGLGHIFHHGKMYGGRDATLVSSTGAARNGIEHYKGRIVSRGVLLDIARYKGVDALRPGALQAPDCFAYHRPCRASARTHDGEEDAMAVTELNHYFVRANDLEKTKEFYCDVLGFEVMPRPTFPFPGYWLGVNGKIQVHMGPDGIEHADLYYLGTPKGAATDHAGVVDHIAFLANDPAGFSRRLKDKGVEFQPRSLPEFDLYQIFLKDPNGLTIELNFFGLKDVKDWGGEDYAAMPKVAGMRA